MSHPRTGSELLFESLLAHGAKKIFNASGENPVNTGDLRSIDCRHEGAAAMMAGAYGRLTGHPGICLVTRGPGACNAAIGVHAAMRDSTPLILLVRQVARGKMGREAFQEIDCRLMFQPPIAKWAMQIENAADIPRLIREVFEAATGGRPGPVVVALPEDMLRDESDAPMLYPQEPLRFAPTHTDIEHMRSLLQEAKKPLVIAGGSGWTEEAMAAFENFCARAALPVATGSCRRDIFHNDHDCYAGALGFGSDVRLAAAVREADIILAAGTRLGESVTQGYTLLTSPNPAQRLIHVYPDASELNKVYRAELAIHSGVTAFAKALENINIDGSGWALWTESLHQRQAEWSAVASRDKFGVDLDGVMEDLGNVLPDDAILAMDAGRFNAWPERYISCNRPMRLLAPESAASGFGVPAAIAASLTYPERTVIGFVNRDGFMKTGQELATAVKAGVRVILLLFNDDPAASPDFLALARSYGAEALPVSATAEFLPVFEKALALKKTVLIDIRVDGGQAAI